MSVSDIYTEGNDPLGLEHSMIIKHAANIAGAMLGLTLSDLIEEENKENPDETKIAELKEKYTAICKERQEIYDGNVEVIMSVEERYIPLIRKRASQMPDWRDLLL
jgi:hypothetical protein